MAYFLEIKWSISKGKNTYGYNICTLTDTRTDKKYRTCAGGVSMTGNVLGQWLEEQYQAELQAADLAACYGVRKLENGDVSINGACGVAAITDTARKIGLKMESVFKNGHVIGFIVEKV